MMSKTILLLAVLITISSCGIISGVKKQAEKVIRGTAGLLEGDVTKYLLPEIATQSFQEIVRSLGYPLQTHFIITQDHYENQYFRIQAKGTKIKAGLPVVYLQHGFLDSSDAWVINEEDQAIGFILANAGYDVWLGNTRGNTYSTRRIPHINNTGNYWDFSWQDMALKDLPAAFEYIYNQTQLKINYIGHSQGASLMLVALSTEEPTILKYLDKYIALAPVTHLGDVRKILRAVTQTRIGYLLPKVGATEFLVLPPKLRKGLATVCQYETVACKALVKLAFDSDLSVDNIDRYGVFFGHFPAGTSAQNFEYWNQLFVSGFRMFDYGWRVNLEKYGHSKPPQVDLSKIKVPVYLFAGTSDVLAPLAATQRVVKDLVNSKVTYKVYDLGHMSFVWAKDVKGYFKDVLEVLKN